MRSCLVAALRLGTAGPSLHGGRADHVRWAASVAAPNIQDDKFSDPLVAQGARELGLDRLSLKDLQALSRASLPSKEALEKDVMQPKKKRLTWGDIPGAFELLAPFEGRNPPREPVYDSHEWVNKHYPRYGYAARGPLYSWRDWAEAALPQEDLEAYLATEKLMADDERRSGLVKQAQWELARLWDWQQRRSDLGLPTDLRETGPSPLTTGSLSNDDSDAAARGTKVAEVERPSPSMSQENVEPPTVEEPEPEADGSKTAGGVLSVLEQSGMYGDVVDADAQAASEGIGSSRVARRARARNEEAKAIPPGDGVNGQLFDDWARIAIAGRGVWERTRLVNSVLDKLEAGRRTAAEGIRRSVKAEIKRVHTPVHDGEDPFLPALPYDDEAAAAESLPPMDPQEVSVAAEEMEAAAMGRVQGRGSRRRPTSALGSLSCWSDLPLLDRKVLDDKLVQELAAKAAPKFLGRVGAHWSPPDDGWTFDLTVRPPTPALDLLTDYLEVKYRDLLLKRDAVTTLHRRVYAQRLAGSGGEAAELPPAALSAPLALSPSERRRVVDLLDASLAAGDLGRYRSIAAGLYRDGLISAGELNSCLAAATAAAAEHEEAAAGVSLDASGREELFRALSGSRDGVAQAQWDAAAARAQAGGAGNDSAYTSLSLDDARSMWQVVLSRAGLQQCGPSLDHLLSACSSGTNEGGRGADLQFRLLQLHGELKQALGDTRAFGEAGSGSGNVSEGSGVNSIGAGSSSVAGQTGSLQEHLWQLTRSAVAQTSPASGTVESGASGSAPGTDAASLQERHRVEMEVTPLVQAPYPGARRLLQWEQQIVFHAAAATEAHPYERQAVLRVHAAELAEEVGLTPAAVRQMLRIAGTKEHGGRYDTATGEIRLACDRFPTREENRRWCLEALHRLVAEADKADPSSSFLFSSSPQRAGSACHNSFL